MTIVPTGVERLQHIAEQDVANVVGCQAELLDGKEEASPLLAGKPLLDHRQVVERRVPVYLQDARLALAQHQMAGVVGCKTAMATASARRCSNS